MYAAPPDLQTTVFARVPDHLQIRDRTTEWLAGRAHGQLGCFLEGPSFDRQGRLWCTDIPFGRILRVSPEGEFTVVAEYDGEPNGLKIHRDGRVFIADQKQGLLVLDPDTGRIEPFLIRAQLQRLKGPNDLVFAANGDLYFTDQGQSDLRDPTGRVIRVRADGRTEVLLDCVPSPNGIVLDPAEHTLFVAVTRANQIWRVPLNADGTLGRVGTFIQMTGGGGPDGMAMDAQGNLAVAHAGLGSVWLFSTVGEPLARIRACTGGRMTTNLAYGGPDRRTLFITESATGCIISARMDVPGLTMFSHR